MPGEETFKYFKPESGEVLERLNVDISFSEMWVRNYHLRNDFAARSRACRQRHENIFFFFVFFVPPLRGGARGSNKQGQVAHLGARSVKIKGNVVFSSVVAV